MNQKNIGAYQEQTDATIKQREALQKKIEAASERILKQRHNLYKSLENK